MKIPDPVLVPDVSSWCDHINAKEFEDGGCGSVVVGLYPERQTNGKLVLSPVSRAQCVEVATHSSMILQAYFWDDITLDPFAQADWLAETILQEGLPIKFVWGDQEQWWTNWTVYNKASAGKVPWSFVPRASPLNISLHYQAFMFHLSTQISGVGVYTNNGFVSSWSPSMGTWLSRYKAWPAEYGRQPAVPTRMTWAELKASWMPTFDLILAPGQLPDQVVGEQFTDDCILPGSYNRIGQAMELDVSVFSAAWLKGLVQVVPLSGTTVPPIAVPVPTGVLYVKTGSWIFATPNDGAGCKCVGMTTVNEAVTVSQASGAFSMLASPVVGWVRTVDLSTG